MKYDQALLKLGELRIAAKRTITEEQNELASLQFLLEA
jgi:hypothetical protein